MTVKKRFLIDDLRLTKRLGNRAQRRVPLGCGFVNRQSKIVNPLVLLVYTLLTALMTWPLIVNFTVAIPGDSFDGWQNYWNLWWVKTALVDGLRSPYVTDLLYAPTGVNLYFHTLNPFNGLFSLPVQLSAGLIPAYNTIVFFSWVMGGYGTYLLTWWLLGASDRKSKIQNPKSAAFVAGVIFTFSPFHMAHLLGHMQVMSLQWIPFYVLYLLRAMQESRNENKRSWTRSALLAGLFLTLTGLCDWYFVLYLLLFTALAIGWRWLTQGQISWQTLGFALRPAMVAGSLFLLLLSPILMPMIREAIQFSFMVRPTTDLYTFSASVMDFLVPNRLHTLLRPQSFAWIGNQIAPPSEKTISIGYLPLLLTLVAGWKDRRRATFWLAGALFFFVMALGPRIHLGNITATDIPAVDATITEWTPYALLNRIIPFMRISRSVSRYALMVQLCVAVAAGIGLAALTKTNHRRSPGLLVCLLILAEFWVAPYPLSPPDTPDFYTGLRDRPNSGAVLNLPMNYDRPGYLLYQTVHQKPLTVAYISRDDPRTLTERVPVLQHFRHLGPDILALDPAKVGMTVLHDLGVGIVVQDRYKMPSGEERIYTEALANAIFTGQAAIYEDERLTMHEVQTPRQLAAYLVLGEFNWGPLQTDKAGVRNRSLTDKPARLYFQHLPAKAQLRIRYRTPLDAGLDIAALDSGETLFNLPSAPAGNEVVIDIPESNRKTGITLSAQAATGVQIEMIELLLP